MISKKDLKEQRMMQMLIDLQEMGDRLVSSIKMADWKNVERFKMPTPSMEMAVESWEGFCKIKSEGFGTKSICGCGHVAGHHVSEIFKCTWEGCGCPKFIVDVLQ